MTTSAKYLPAPFCAFVVNGLEADLIHNFQPDWTGATGPYAWATKNNGSQSRVGVGCRDIFLNDVRHWSQILPVYQGNNGVSTLAFTFRSAAPRDGANVTVDELRARLKLPVETLRNALRSAFDPNINADFVPVNSNFSEDASYVSVYVTYPPRYWGNLLFASFMAAVCRSWLHLEIVDSSATVANIWTNNKLNWSITQEYNRFNRPPPTLPKFTMEHFVQLVNTVGKMRSPMTMPGSYLTQTTWETYFHEYAMSCPERDVSQTNWRTRSSSSMGCYTVYNHLGVSMTPVPKDSHPEQVVMARSANAFLVPSFAMLAAAFPDVYPANQLQPNYEKVPVWLKDAFKGKPAPSVERVVPIEAATTSPSTPTATRTATPAASAARRAAR